MKTINVSKIALLLAIFAGVFLFVFTTEAATTVTQGVTNGWAHNKNRNVFYNGENYFLIYNNGGTEYFYKSSSDNVTWSATNTLISSVQDTNFYNVYFVDDKKFDITADVIAVNNGVSTCTISGQTISCGATSATIRGSAGYNRVIVRNPFSNRIYYALYDGTSELEVYSANQTGDANNITAWTGEITTQETLVAGEVTMVPYANSDCVLVIYQRDLGGALSDGIY